MSSIPRFATGIYGGILVAVATIAVSLLVLLRLWKTYRDGIRSEEVASITLFQGSSNFQIREINASVILNGDRQLTKIQRNLICDCIANLPDISNNVKEHVLNQSIIATPQHEDAGFKYYQNKKKSGSCFKGTRVALLREMADCVTGSSESRIYVLSGPAGIGKSTVAYTIASRAADLNLLGASFFFSRDEANRKTGKKFFTTIAYQLCVYNEMFAKAIGDVLGLWRGSVATTQDLQNQLNLLILDPLRSIVQSCSRPILIVVDALDECDEEDAISVLTGLSQLVQDLPPFRVILTTRPKLYFDRFWGSQDGHQFFHLQDIENKVVDDDIRIYLDHNLSTKEVQKRYPKCHWCASDEEIDFLVRAAGSLFIIASTTVRYIFDKTVSNPAAQMKILLYASAHDLTPFKDLYHFYTIILRNIIPANCDNDDIVSRYQSVVGAIIFVQHPLPVSTLSHLIGIGVEEIRAVLDKLQSMILLGDDDTPHIYHKSFPEYLTDYARCKDPNLRIDPGICHTQIATRCFEIMDKHLKYNILDLGTPARFMSNEDGLEKDGITAEQLEEKIPQQLRYACIYWVKHLELGNIEDAALMNGLEKFANEHLLHWFEVLSLIGKLDSAYHAIPVVLKLLKSSSELHQLLSDAFHFIGKFDEIIQRSALHTYYSALSFTPTGSLLYHRYNKEAARNICAIEGRPEKWDGMVANLRHDNIGGCAWVIEFSLDGALIVSCSEHPEMRGQAKLKIWDAATGAPISTIPGDRFAIANEFSTISSSQGNIATLYNTNGTPSGAMFTTPSKIEKLALSFESGRVAAASYDGTVWLWETRNAKLIDRFADGSRHWPRLQFSPTGTRLAYLSVNGIVKLRDGISGRSIADLRCGPSDDIGFEFSGDGTRIASMSHPSGLRLWNSESGGLIAAVTDDYGQWGLAISPNGSLLATIDAGLKLWSKSEDYDHLVLVDVPESSSTRSMAFSLDNILAIGIDYGIKLYDIKTHSIIHTLPLPRGEMPVALAFSPDCARLAVGDDRGNVNLWDLRGIGASGHPLKEATAVTALALSRDCSRLACGFGARNVELWSTNPTKRRIASHQADLEHGGLMDQPVRALGFRPDSGLFASGLGDGTINLWNGEDGSLRGTLKAPSGLGPVSLSNSVLVAAGDGVVTLWSLDTLSLIHTFVKSSYRTPNTVSISENNALIAVAHCHDVSLLDAENHTVIATFNVPHKIHTIITFLPDNLQLVAQSKEGVFLSFNLINKHIMEGATFENLIQLPNVSLWHGVPIWHCLDKEQHYLTASFPEHKSPVPVLWIPRHIPVTAWAQGSSMIALGCWDGRIILLRPC